MNNIITQIKELKVYTFNALLRNSFKPLTKTQYFDNTFSSLTFKEMFFSTLVEEGFEKIYIGFEDKLLRSLINGKKDNV
ncbi:MAG: hypothetical protein ACK4NF_07475 [Planctomycetota bacterium]